MYQSISLTLPIQEKLSNRHIVLIVIILVQNEIETKIKISSKRANGFFALVFDKRHKEYKDASLFLEEDVGFNGNPNDVENMLPDCHRYQCMNIEERKRRDGFLKCLLHVDYCTVYRKEIWKIKRTLKFDCRFGKPQNQNLEVNG